jgi:hypothetical protein
LEGTIARLKRNNDHDPVGRYHWEFKLRTLMTVENLHVAMPSLEKCKVQPVIRGETLRLVVWHNFGLAKRDGATL